MKELMTERLSLKLIEQNDVNEIYNNILNDKEVLHFLDFPYCNSLEEAKVFVNELVNKSNNGYYFWSIYENDTNEFIGFISISNLDSIRRLCELEIALLKKARGKGYAKEVANSVINFLIKECNYYRIEGVCNIENTCSSKLMESVGMKFEGILRGRALNLNDEGNPGDLKMYSIIASDLQ